MPTTPDSDPSAALVEAGRLGIGPSGQPDAGYAVLPQPPQRETEQAVAEAATLVSRKYEQRKDRLRGAVRNGEGHDLPPVQRHPALGINEERGGDALVGDATVLELLHAQ